MAKNFKVGIIVEGDGKGGIKAVEATRKELRQLAKQTKTSTDQAKLMRKAYANAGAAASRGLKVAGVLGAGAAAALTVLVKRSFETADSLGKIADTINTDTEALAGLRVAADLTGLSAGEMDKAVERMVRSIGDARNGSKLASDAVAKLGVNLDEFSQLRADEQFALISEGIGRIENRADQAAIATALFGRNGVRLLNTLDLGPEKLRQITEELERLNVALSREEVAAIEAANDSITRMQTVAQGLGNTIAVQVAPFIEDIATRFYEASLSSGGFEEQVRDGMRAVASAVGFVGDSFRGVQVVLQGIEIAGIGASVAIAGAWIKMGNAVETVINAWLTPLNLVIDAAQAFGADISNIELDFSDFGAFDAVEGFVSAGPDMIRQARDEMQTILMKPLPSEAIDQWFEEVQSGSGEASKRLTGLFGKGGTVPAAINEGATENAAALQSLVDRLLPDEAALRQYEQDIQTLTLAMQTAADPGQINIYSQALAALRGQFADTGEAVQEELVDPVESLRTTLIDLSTEWGTAAANMVSGAELIADAFKDLNDDASLEDVLAASAAGFAQLAGGAKLFFDEGTGGYEGLEAAEKAFRAIQIAEAITATAVQLGLIEQTTAAQLASDAVKALSSGVVAAVSSMAGLPFPANFLALGATIAAIAALGVKISGGGGGAGAAGPAQTVGSTSIEGGGVGALGDAQEASDALLDALGRLVDIARPELELTSQMAASLRSIEMALAGVSAGFEQFATQIGQQGFNITGTAGAPEISLSNAPTGIEALMMSGKWSDFLAEMVAGGVDTRLTNPQSILSQARIGAGIEEFFTGLEDALVLGASAFGVDPDVGRRIFQSLDLDLELLEGDDIDESIRDFFNRISDAALIELSSETGIPVLAFQRQGETLTETLFRISSGMDEAGLFAERLNVDLLGLEVLGSGVEDVGAELLRASILAGDFESGIKLIVDGFDGGAEELAELTGELAGARQALDLLGGGIIAIHPATLRAAGGLESFLGGLELFESQFFNETEQFDFNAARLSAALAELGQGAIPSTREAFRDLILAGALPMDESLIRLADTFYDVRDPIEGVSQAIGGLQSAANDLIGSLDLELQRARLAGDAAVQDLQRQRTLEPLNAALNVAVSTGNRVDELRLQAAISEQVSIWAEQDRRAASSVINLATEPASAPATARRSGSARSSSGGQAGFSDLADQLRSFVTSLNSDVVDPAQSFVSTYQEFFRTANAARAKDQDAIQALSGIGQSVVDLALKSAGTELEYKRIVGTVAGTVGAVADTLSPAERQVDLLEDQLDVLNRIREQLNPPGFAAGGQHSGGLRWVGENGPELEFTGPSTIMPVGPVTPAVARSDNRAVVSRLEAIERRFEQLLLLTDEVGGRSVLTLEDINDNLDRIHEDGVKTTEVAA